MTGRDLSSPAGLLATGLRPDLARPAACGGGRPDRAAHGPGRCRRRPVRARRLGRAGGGRPPAPTVSLESSPLDPDARRGRPAPARRPPSRRRVPGHGRLAPRRLEPQGLGRRPVRDPLRDLRPDARRRRGRLVGRRRGRHRRAGHDRSPGTTAARCAATSAAAPSSARRRSTPTTCGGPRPTSAPRRCARSLLARFPDRARAPRACPTSCSTSTRGRQLVGLGAILERIESDLRAAPVLAALRLALLHAILPASRLATQPGRTGALRGSSAATSGRRRGRSCASGIRGSPSRTRSGWSAGSSSASTAGRLGPVQARLGEDLRSLGEGTATAVLGLSGPGGPASPCATTRTRYGRTAPTPRVRLVLGQPPMRPSLERLGARLPRARRGCSVARPPRSCRSMPLAGASLRVAVELAGGRDRAVRSRRSTRDGARRPRRPARRRPGRRRSSPTVLGGATAGYRLLGARLADADDDAAGDRRAAATRRPPAARCRGRARTSGSDPLPGRRRRPGHGPVGAACSRRPSGSTSGRSRRPTRPAP